ncbi:MAG TPA: sigma-54 dependent transcriptional regulator [Vicinamibacterales bacterium]|nr:sigma-54 dependent transcriptional regulator [Vicinamibacterales bacterium]
MASRRIHQDSPLAAERTRLVAENHRLRQELRERDRLSEIVGNSRAMRHVCEQIAQVARTSGPVMLRGEPGSGRTLAARAIHGHSARAGAPFVTVTCAALPETVVDSHSRGGPTIAYAAGQMAGYVQRANAGTLFLDEIADLGPLAQERLLMLIEDGVVEGHDGASVHADVRVIAASSWNLEEAVTGGSFRRDVYERLSTTTIAVPPLRDRKADLPALTELFVERFAREHARRVDRLSARAMDMVMHYDWPGNARELGRAIERAVVLANGPVIHHHHLPAVVQEAARTAPVPPVPLSEALDAYEMELLQDALKQTRGVRSKAARLLGTTERILSYRLRKHRIDWRRFKDRE